MQALFNVNYGDETWLWLFALLIVISFIAALVIVPWVLIHLPANYFTHQYRKTQGANSQHTILRLVILLGKNLLGGLLILIGIFMLVLPGQGILTIFIGIMVMDFPGKYRCERWLIRKQPILRSVNWLRQKWGRDSLDFD